MKVAIIGGGISGLSTYLNLQKHVTQDPRLKESFDVTLFEPHDLVRLGDKRPDNIPSVGGGYGIAPNGMASLRRLDPELHDKILRNGFPAPKTTMKSARGWVIGTIPFCDLRGKEPEACIMVLRDVVIGALYDCVQPPAVVRHKVVEVHDGDNASSITLDNGEIREFDLVIGADGIWSKARHAILCENPAPEYKGLFTVGGFISTDYLPVPPETGQAAHSQTVMTFGPNGFFAYTPYTTGDVEATKEHMRGDATLPPGNMAFWWSRSAQKESTANPDEKVLKQELEKRHHSWKDPVIHKIIQNSEVSLKVPTFVLPKISTWTGKRVVLIGDAAHALPSSSGQGISQCLEDSEAFSMLLIHNLATSAVQKLDSPTLSTTFKQYTAVRKAHVEAVLDVGNRAGDTSREMGPVAEMAMYGFMWAMFRLFGAFFLKSVMNYDVVAEVEKAKRKKQ